MPCRAPAVTVALAVLATVTGEVRAQYGGSSITDVTAIFRPASLSVQVGGYASAQYAALSVDSSDPYRIAIGTLDGYVLWSEDGGRSATESRAISKRLYDPYIIRSGSKAVQSAQLDIALPGIDAGKGRQSFPERSLRIFLHNLGKGHPPARFAFWMMDPDAIPEIMSVSWSPGNGPMAVAGPAGVYLSNEGRGSWLKTLGSPSKMPRKHDMQAISVGLDPLNPRRVLAGTDRGIYISDNGGRSFLPHPDPRTAGDYVLRFIFDPENPRLVFAVTPDTILLSEDSGTTFEPAFSTGTEIYDLGLSPEAAVIATSDGVQVATSNGVIPLLKGKQVVGAIPWRNGTILAATTEALYEVDLQDNYRMIAQTTPSDSFVALGGNPELAWAITPTTVLRIGDPIAYDYRPGYEPPRMLMSSIQVERAVRKYHALPPPGELYLHPRWYAQFVPQLWFSARGGTYQTNRLLFDGEFPVSYRYAEAYANSRFGYEVTLRWDLSMAVLGEDSNVVHPDMVIDSQLRNGIDTALREVRARYRQAHSLVKRLKNPPSDPEVDFYWRMRLEELAAYLERMTGKPVVANIDLENLE